jgi:NADH-quinone oxidoreductase subunit A
VLNNYVPILVMFVLALGFVVVSVASAAVIGPKRYNRPSSTPTSAGSSRRPSPWAAGGSR